MTNSPTAAIELLINGYLEKRWDSKPFEQAMEIASRYPNYIRPMAESIIDHVPDGGTFLDAVLSYLPMTDWAGLIEYSISKLSGREKNRAAESVIEYASEQCPNLLHPHLSEIFDLAPNAGSYCENRPWRNANEEHHELLQQIAKDSARTEHVRKKAWLCLLETRHPNALRWVVSNQRLATLDLGVYCGIQPPNLNYYLKEFGFHLNGSELVKLYPEDVFHIVFPESYFYDEDRPIWLQRVHPTWMGNGALKEQRFGGGSRLQCSACQGMLHQIMTIDPIPEDLGVSITRVELCTCLSCLGWEQEQVFCRHDKNGNIIDVVYGGAVIEPEFPAVSFQATKVQIVRTPSRWHWQDWGASNGRENLNRIGGHPSWVQSAEYPHCPSCDIPMAFLLQLDSYIPTEDGGEWLWGSGGVCYCFWCDDCRISGFLWQCT